MKNKRFITYSTDGKVKYHRFLFMAKLRARFNHTYIDINDTGIIRTLIDYTKTNPTYYARKAGMC